MQLTASTKKKFAALLAPYPALSAALRAMMRHIRKYPGGVPFESTAAYWEARYRAGGNSGAGSYGRLACFKADTINRFVREHGVRSVVEFGCGDGAQLALSEYLQYVGIDISPHIVAVCREKFRGDPTKTFYAASDGNIESISAELALSLDVVFHLVEDENFERYMRQLVGAASRYICIYSSNVDMAGHVPHIRHHCITDWFANHAAGWTLLAKIANPYPVDDNNPAESSFADFYFYTRND